MSEVIHGLTRDELVKRVYGDEPLKTITDMSDREKSERAKKLHERQRHYDMLHHKRRIEWLGEPPCTWADGTELPECLRINLLNLSQRIIKEGISCKSVDLNDLDYLAVLDEFNSLNEVTK